MHITPKTYKYYVFYKLAICINIMCFKHKQIDNLYKPYRLSICKTLMCFTDFQTI